MRRKLPLLGTRPARAEQRVPAESERRQPWVSLTHTVLVRSYLKPGAAFRSSLDEFIVSCHLLSLRSAFTDVNGTMTCFSPMPRKPPTPITSALILPSALSSTSSTSPILLLPGS